MLPSVFVKVLHDHWRPLLVWTIFSGAFGAFYLALYPSIGAAAEMQQMLDSMPAGIRAMFAAEGADISTPAGYLNVEYFTFVVPLLVFAATVPVGAGATAGEEERGTLELLLANPIPRWRVVLEKSLAVAFVASVVAAGIWLALAVAAFAAGIDLAMDRVAAALVSAALLGVVIGELAMAVGSLTGSRMLSIGLALGVAVVGFFVNALGPLVEGLKPWRVLSPHYHYLGYDPLASGLDLGHAGVLATMSLVAVAIGVVAFQRRDLRH